MRKGSIHLDQMNAMKKGLPRLGYHKTIHKELGKNLS
jgi:hypothetical protein